MAEAADKPRLGIAVWRRALLGVGLSLVAAATGLLAFGEIESRRALEEIDRQVAAASPRGESRRLVGRVVEGELLGKISVPRLDLVAPVREGTSDATLRIGAGHVAGTALPGERGNAVIAGHRDTHFRALRGIREGDQLRFSSRDGERVFRVTGTRVVAPSDVGVLATSSEVRLTLVTCYPFSFVGPAPRRLVISALESRGRSPRRGLDAPRVQ
jgi:sortase A